MIVDVRVLSGWLLDQITFITHEGLHLGPLGHSDGGNVNTIMSKDFWPAPKGKPEDREGPGPHRRRRRYSERSDDEDFFDYSDYDRSYSSDESDSYNRPTMVIGGRWVDGERRMAVALHGFSYKNITSHGQAFWNEVKFHFAAVDEQAVRHFVPNANPDEITDLMRPRKFPF